MTNRPVCRARRAASASTSGSSSTTVPTNRRVTGCCGSESTSNDRALLDDAAGLHHRDAVGEAAHDVHLVGDDHDGDAELAVDPAEEGEHLAGSSPGRARWSPRRRAGAAGWWRARGRCRRAASARPRAARVAVRLVGEADEVEQVGDPRVLLGLGDAGHLERVGDVAPHGARAEQVELLEDHADPQPHLAQLALLQAGDLPAADPHAARGGGLERVDQPHERGLPGAGVAHDADDLTGLDRQVDTADRLDGRPAACGRERLVHVGQLDERHRGLLPYWLRVTSAPRCRPRRRRATPAARPAGPSPARRCRRRRPARRRGRPASPGRPRRA